MKSTFLGVLILLAAGSAAAQDALNGARELYASAAYEDALTTLTKLQASDASNIEQIGQYRAFCLFALGRVAEAQTVADTLITKNPLLELNTTDASPRIAAMFTDARKRLLPALIRDQYRGARGAVDRKDFAAAEPQLKQVRKMIDEAEKVGAVDDTLTDLRVLTDGFLDLAHAAIARTAAPAAAENVAAGAPPTGAPPASTTAAPKRDETAAANVAPRIYDHTATDVVAPVTVRQAFPPVPHQLQSIMALNNESSGHLDILIDETGSVEKAVMRDPLNAIYDRLVVQAARTWKYRPATRDGHPVKYLKTIAVALK